MSPTTQKAQPASLLVMSYNLRYASDRPPNAWRERLPVMAGCLREWQPDIIGTQEGLYPQLKSLAANLPEYEWLGLGREGGSHGEFMAVFYRRQRFEPLEFDHFWLSDTPSVIGSTTWGNDNRRMVTWIRFLDRTSNQEFYLFNTHFDHQVQEAREKAAALLLERVKALKTKLPVIVTGDFNATAGQNKAYDILVNDDGFRDTWVTAAERRSQAYTTFTNFRAPVESDRRIDWILTRGPVEAEAIEIRICQEGKQQASDHLPVLAWLRIPGR